MTKAQKAERAEAIARMHEWVKPGDTVYTILRHVSRSGMQREIGVVLMLPDDRKRDLDARHGGMTPVDLHPNYPVAKVIGARVGKRDGVIMGGCGMDMGFALVYELSARLYPDGFGCIGAGCPSNDHGNGDRDYTVHGEVAPGPGCAVEENDEPRYCVCHDNSSPQRPCSGCGCHPAEHWHRDGGYALKQRWL
jgi:hypothetical protein